MFQSARQNTQIYVLTKGVKPTLEVGNILNNPQTRVGQFNQQANPYQFPPQMVVDIVAQVGADTLNLTGLPADKAITDWQGNSVVSVDKNLILNEINALKQTDENTIKMYETAKERLPIYNGMRDILFPEEAEKARNAEKIRSLEDSLAQQASINKQMLEQLQLLTKQNEALASKLEADKTNKSKKQEQ